MRPATLYVSNASGHLDHLVAPIGRAFEVASVEAQLRLGADGVDVIFVEAPDDVIPEWGVGGTTWSAHVVIVAIDPSVDIQERHIVATLLHEFHHSMRFRGPGCGGSLAQMLVSEGLACLFEEEVLGSPPFFVNIPLSPATIREADEALFDSPFEPAKWFFGSEDVAKSFGYAYGYRRCKSYAAAVGRSAAELVNASSAEILGVEETIVVAINGNQDRSLSAD